MKFNRPMTRFRMTSLGLALALAGKMAAAQFPGMEPPPPPVDPHDISGYWELEPNGRSVPLAKLASGVTPEKMVEMEDGDRISARWCRPLGMPAEMDNGRPISIVQGDREVALTFEANANPRHFYFRDKHTDPNIFDPSSVGDSIAHWEGDTLVVDTIGFHPTHGMLTIPGGGFRTANSHLEERYKMIKNGQVLSVTSTWTDPSVFAEPHTYEFRYARVRGMYEPRQPISCDPWDEDQSAFVERSFPPELRQKAEAATPPAAAAADAKTQK